MSKTNSFRAQHDAILEIVAKVDRQLSPNTIAENAKDVEALLSELSGSVRIHLAAEDASLYPNLMNSPNADIRKLGEKYASEMGGISSAFKDYISKWGYSADKIKSSSSEFITETSGILNILKDRIDKENSILYKKYDEM